MRRAAAALVLFLAAVSPAAAVDSEAAIQAMTELPEDQLLDVGIRVFDPGLGSYTATELEERGIFEEVRGAEAIFVPVQIKRTLESTGQWGAVRVVPTATDAVDLLLTGALIESNGKDLAFALRAQDATGRVWLDKRYRGEANSAAYGEEGAAEVEPFQGLYNGVANDLLAKRQRLKETAVIEARRVARAKFAADLAPESFGDLLEVDRRGRSRVARLPAEGDPMMERVDRIRERDYMLVDTLNEYYSTFFDRLAEPYRGWRSFSYEERLAFEELRRKGRWRKILGALAVLGAVTADADSQSEAAVRDVALIGGIAAIQSGIGKTQEAKIHREALRELGVSFGSEVAPVVVDVEGQTLRLTGSAETQYETWRRLLRELYANERGLAPDPNVDSGLAMDEPTAR